MGFPPHSRSMFRDRSASQMAEAAVTLPVVLLFLAFGMDVARAGRAAVAARDAADYGARVASVVQSNNVEWAKQAVKADLAQSGILGGDPQAELIPGAGGSLIRVTVSWASPTVFSGLCPLFGGSCPLTLTGSETAVWQVEEH